MSDHPFHEQLPIYAAAIAIGVEAELRDPDFAAHLAGCPTCAADLQELLALVWPAYSGKLDPAEHYPAADLTFLEAPMSVSLPAAPIWLLEAGRLVIGFSDALLVDQGQSPLLGVARAVGSQLIYRYVQEPGSVHNLQVSVEVYAEDVNRQQGRVQVAVDVASRDPLEQNGSLVTLHMGEASWQAETDETGCVEFAPIPLDDLASLRVEISPLKGLKV
jgi:hypothetical protein